MTWHDISQLTTLPHLTSPHNQPHYFIAPCNQPHQKQVTTSPPWNGWRLVHSNNSVWASQSLVTLCTFYRQILSLTYSFFSWKLPPPACPALLVNDNYIHLNNGSPTWKNYQQKHWGDPIFIKYTFWNIPNWRNLPWTGWKGSLLVPILKVSNCSRSCSTAVRPSVPPKFRWLLNKNSGSLIEVSI